ncbi:FKBP-type peptidyl-prolyl cis-trans isomerase [Naasia sp. SYSU D00948]|uniref:FKBP-type peptidyl-prolyl cis-trans isomerase n=1 Tax=Naasia sp. SYSU D00948 TaxID=2817379 RepID=UPI001B310351|nr:FKBP-type peptidyl-prolyl cis-trans isomerase [Naasia sp. SYSU D00948]
MNRRLPRAASALLVAASLLGGLSACYVGPSGAAECRPEARPGNASDAVKASGAVLSQPTVSFPTPLLPGTTQASTVIRGEGEPIRGDQYVAGYLSIFNGSTGELLDQSDYGAGLPSSFVIDRLPIEGLKKGLQCAEVGSRVAVVMPGDEAFSDENRPAGLTAEDSLVVVVDFKDAYLGRAQGTAQVAQAGMPSVVLAPDGRPGITVPQAAAPEKLRVSTLIAGNGEKVAEGDSVLVNYTGVLWDTGEVFDSSWENGAPITIALNEGEAIPGFLSAVTGKRVGDQVLAVIPPDQGYGDQATGSIPADSTLVFVIDILGIVE